jgi:hypothetical protein
MLLLATNALPTTRRLREPEWYGPSLGRLLTPRHYSSAGDTVADAIPVAADNDCFQGLDEPAFLAMLDALAPHAGDMLWVTAPDVVGDAAGTLQRFAVWGPRIRARGFRVALVLQDGMTIDSVPWGEFDAVFVGGSTEYKLGDDAAAIVRAARARGLQAHMGRVNSYKRARYAWQIGCTSVDGSGWARFKTAMRPRWFALVNDMRQGILGLEGATA